MSSIQNTEGLQIQRSLQGGSKFKEIKNALQTYNIQAGYKGTTMERNKGLQHTDLHSKSKGAHDTDALLPDIADICTLCNKQSENNPALQYFMNNILNGIERNCFKM